MYRHTQVGTWVIFLAGSAAVALFISGLLLHGIQFYLIAICLILALALFGSLTIIGDNDELAFHFGIGGIKRRFRYNNLQSIRKVRNKWYWGWGIRWFGRGWLYNVSGLDAVELILKSGKVVRIGTDDPDSLLRFVENRLNAK